MPPTTRERLTQPSMIDILRKYHLELNEKGYCYGFTMLEGLYHLQPQAPSQQDIKIFLEILDKAHLPVRKILTESNFAEKASLLKPDNFILIEKSLEAFQQKNPLQADKCEKLKKYLYAAVKRPLLYEENLKILSELENQENKQMIKEIIQKGPYIANPKMINSANCKTVSK